MSGKMKTPLKAKISVPAAVFCVTLAGQVFHSSVVFEVFDESYISYSLIIALISYFIIDFITASGLLQRKILFIKLLTVYFALLVITNRFLLPRLHLPGSIYVLQLMTTVLLIVVVVICDNLLKSKNNFKFIQNVIQVPPKYLRPRPILFILETVFRLFPVPEPVALYKVGSPHKSSPVIVTGNYELTVRRVAKSLRGLDCWLLVCDSRGINVWCSTLSGHFSERDIINAFELMNVSEYASSGRFILPQLCAPGVDIREINQKTGLSAVFGPVYSENIRKFISQARDVSKIRNVKFDLRDRVEMAIGSPMILTGVLLFIYLFIDLSRLFYILPGLYSISVLLAVLYPYRPLKRIPLWASLWLIIITGGILGFTIFTGLFHPTPSIGIAVTVGIGTFYLINEFEGWSPLVKYNFRSMYRGVEVPEININEELCSGCGLCTDVCPKGVFIIKEGTSKVINAAECIECSACYSRCPKEAIKHSSDKREKDVRSGVYCKM